jgi:membrane protease YdiL (CAAX protease family)
MKRLWTASWKIVCFFILWAILYAPFIVPFRRQLEQPMATTRLYVEAMGAVTVVVAAVIMRRFVEKRPAFSLGLAPQPRSFVIGLALGVLLITLAVASLWLMGFARRVAITGFSGSILAMAALVVVANSVTQEVLFRGYIQQTIESCFTRIAAILGSALLFGLFHAGAIRSMLSALNIFAAGCLLGVGYAITRNLWLPIGLHCAWNFVQGPLLGLTVSGQSLSGSWRVFLLDGPALLTGGAFGLEGGIVATVVTLLGIGILVKLYPPPSCIGTLNSV